MIKFRDKLFKKFKKNQNYKLTKISIMNFNKKRNCFGKKVNILVNLKICGRH